MRKLYATEEERKLQRAAYQRAWRRKNPEKFKRSRIAGEVERHKKYYENNRQKVDAYKQSHRYANKERYNELARERHKKNPMRQKIADWKRKYKLSHEQVQLLLEKQNNVCAACKNAFNKTPHVDHCHKTGNVRGLLCGNCNRALGSVNDNIKTLQNMIGYLQEPPFRVLNT